MIWGADLSCLSMTGERADAVSLRTTWNLELNIKQSKMKVTCRVSVLIVAASYWRSFAVSFSLQTPSASHWCGLFHVSHRHATIITLEMIQYIFYILCESESRAYIDLNEAPFLLFRFPFESERKFFVGYSCILKNKITFHLKSLPASSSSLFEL